MGTSASGRPMTDEDRQLLARKALADGTVTRVRSALGWSLQALADQLNVTAATVERWEAGTAHPAPASALKLWRVLVEICRTPTP